MRLNLLRPPQRIDASMELVRDLAGCGVTLSPLVARSAIVMGKYVGMAASRLPGFALVLQKVVDAEIATTSQALLQAVSDILASAENVGVFSDESYRLADHKDETEYAAYVKKRTGTNVELANLGKPLLPILPYAPVYRPLFSLRDAAKLVDLPPPSPEIRRARPWANLEDVGAEESTASGSAAQADLVEPSGSSTSEADNTPECANKVYDKEGK